MQCKAKSKQTGEQCKRSATPGYEVCYYHGANRKNPGGAPENNDNAKTHGAYEALILEALPPEDKETFEQLDGEAKLDEEIRILRLKLLRCLTDTSTDDDIKTKGILIITEQIRKLIDTKLKDKAIEKQPQTADITINLVEDDA